MLTELGDDLRAVCCFWTGSTYVGSPKAEPIKMAFQAFFEEFMQDAGKGRLRDVRMHDCCASTDAIADYCGITGYKTTISTACSSAANAIMTGDRLIRHGILDCVVVGGTDALSAFTLNGFKSLVAQSVHRLTHKLFKSEKAGGNKCQLHILSPKILFSMLFTKLKRQSS